MRVIVEKATQDQVNTFTQNLANTLKCPVFRWKKNQGGVCGTVLEFETLTTDDAEKIVDSIADTLDIDVFFLDYATRKRRM